MENVTTGTENPVIGAVKEKASAFRRLLLWAYTEGKWACRVLLSACDRFYWDNGFSTAASLAYTTLLSLVPVTALGFSILASFVAKSESVPELRNFIFRILKQFAPSTQAIDQVMDYLSQFSQIISSLNELAIVFLVVTSILLLNSIEYALNTIWQVFEPRSIARRIERFSAILVLAPVLAVSAYYTSSRFRVEPLLDDIGWIGAIANSFYNVAIPFLVDWGAFVVLYFFIPKAPVKASSAVVGGLVAAILFGLAKDGFAIYIVQFSAHAAIYGTLAAVPIFLFWLYMAWTVVLFGAEVSFQYQYLPKKGEIWKRSYLSLGDGEIVLAVQALTIVSRCFLEGRKLPSDLEIAEQLGCSTVVLKPIIDLLEGAGIIARGETREMPLALLKNPEKILLDDVKAAVCKTRVAMHYSEELGRLFQRYALAAGAPGAEPVPNKATLADLLKDS